MLFTSSASLIGSVEGTVDACATLTSVGVAFSACKFTFCIVGAGASGKLPEAFKSTLTSTPCPALAHGVCAGALDTILNNLPGAAKNPLLLSYNVSVCACITIGSTCLGIVLVAPVFKLIFEPLI